MKQLFSIFLVVLVIGTCTSIDANAKKKRASSRKATTTATVSKGAFNGFWAERALHGLQLNLDYDYDADTYFGTLHAQEELCSGSGEVKGNTLYLDCNEGYSLSCNLKGRYLIVTINDGSRVYKAKMEK